MPLWNFFPQEATAQSFQLFTKEGLQVLLDVVMAEMIANSRSETLHLVLCTLSHKMRTPRQLRYQWGPNPVDSTGKTVQNLLRELRVGNCAL